MIDGRDVPHYSRQPWPAPTDGPAVRWLKHQLQPGHAGGDPDDCEQCGRDVGHLLHRLRVGQSGRCHGSTCGSTTGGGGGGGVVVVVVVSVAIVVLFILVVVVM